MLVDHVIAHEVVMPLVHPFRTAKGAVGQRRVIIIEMLGDQAGWGECVAFESPFYGQETIDGAWQTITRRLIPLVEGETFDHPQDVHEALAVAAPDEPMARAAIETAAWDLFAKSLGLPLTKLLGAGRRDVPVGIVLDMADPAETAYRATQAIDNGYRRVKIKVEPETAVGVLEAVRVAVDGPVPIAVDANGSYCGADPALLEELDRFALDFIEEPYRDIDLTAQAKRTLRTPLALDETIMSVSDARRAIDAGACDAINIKPGRVGGHTETVAIHRLAVERSMEMWVGGMLETGIGRAHAVAVAALPGFGLASDLGPSSRYWKRDLVSPVWRMVDGTLSVPEAPGIGVAVDRSLIGENSRRTFGNM